MAQAALNNNAHTRVFIPQFDTDITQAFSEVQSDIEQVLTGRVTHHRGIKWTLSVTVRFVRWTVEGELVTSDIVFTSEVLQLFIGDDIEDSIARALRDVFAQTEDFHENGSGWNLEKIVKIQVSDVVYDPLRVGESSFLELPKGIWSSHAVLNVRNLSDSKCIVWSILAQWHPVKRNQSRQSHYKKYEESVKAHGVRFPTPITDISKIERQNDMSIHVFAFDCCEDIVPFRIAKPMKENHVNLLLLISEETNVNHYCLIKNFSLFMKKNQKSTQLYNKRYCFNCLNGFSRQIFLDNHTLKCHQSKAQRTYFPEIGKKDSIIKFTNYKNQLKAPFVIYADFECFTQKSNGAALHTSTSVDYQKHVPSGFCYVVICTDNRYSKRPELYTDYENKGNVVEAFFDKLIQEEKRIAGILSRSVELDRTPAVEEAFKEAKLCHICDQMVTEDDKVRDHDHLTGQYRGAAHNKCNLQYRWSKVNPLKRFGFKIPVVFHNLRGYDCHLLMEAFGKYEKRLLGCIATNQERFITVSTGSLRFIDSFQFMPNSLDRLVSNLKQEGIEKFELMSKLFYQPNEQTTRNSNLSGDSNRKEKLNLLTRKGCFPYDYFDGYKRLNETELPTQEKFFSELLQQECSDSDYEHAKNVWNVFSCKNFGNYHDLYLMTDVLLLADVFENFRSMALSTYKLDPVHYLTAPALSWDSMLR